MKHGRANPRKPPQRGKARFAETIALQTPAHPRMPVSDRHGPRPVREQRAAGEFTRWRTEHPNATTDDLRHRWRQIQVDWNLSAPERTPR